jgi:hypothetical protein
VFKDLGDFTYFEIGIDVGTFLRKRLEAGGWETLRSANLLSGLH